MLDIAFLAFIALVLALGLKRPFFWVLAYIYIDIVAPQKISWGFLGTLPVSLIAFVAAFAGGCSSTTSRAAASAAPGADCGPARLLRVHDADGRLSIEALTSGTGVEGAAVRRLPAAELRTR